MLSGGIDADAYAAMPTALWVMGCDVRGGNLAFPLTTPIGGKRVEAGVITDRFNLELDT